MLGLAGGLASLTTLTGCAHESAADRQFAQMRDDIAKIQADHDRFDNRLNVLEVKTAENASTVPAPRESSGREELRVVHLDPSAPEPQTIDDTSGGAARSVVLRGNGGGAERSTKVRPQDRAAMHSFPEPEEANGPVRASGERPSAIDPIAKKAYEDALRLAQGKSYAQALDAFAAFLVRWPDHPYVPNANYWRGECYFAMGDFPRAAEQFEAVVSRSLTGNKVPDALLKLGMTYDKIGNKTKASEMNERLRREFPQSDAARRLGGGSTKEKR